MEHLSWPQSSSVSPLGRLTTVYEQLTLSQKEINHCFFLYSKGALFYCEAEAVDSAFPALLSLRLTFVL